MSEIKFHAPEPQQHSVSVKGVFSALLVQSESKTDILIQNSNGGHQHLYSTFTVNIISYIICVGYVCWAMCKCKFTVFQ